MLRSYEGYTGTYGPILSEPLSRENLITLHADNKGADQPWYLRSLRNAFVIRSLKRALANLAA